MDAHLRLVGGDVRRSWTRRAQSDVERAGLLAWGHDQIFGPGCEREGYVGYRRKQVGCYPSVTGWQQEEEQRAR